ncbi:Tyrosine-protein kinase, partial [Parasponia andersonii]
MASSISISSFVGVVALATFIFTYVSTASKSPRLVLEADAMLHCGWWSEYVNNTISHCNWPGVTCDDAGSVTEISLSHRYGKENILLEKLDLSCLPNLVHLNLADAGLIGRIPPEIGTLSKLNHLDLSRNSLTGQLPLSLANLSQLVKLDLCDNKLNGFIPYQLGSLKNLVALNLSMNFFGGPIPSALGLLTNLTHLDLSSNKIEGQLPYSITRLAQLEMLDASSNRINGSIPLQMGEQGNLSCLNLSNNVMSGIIPNDITLLPNLRLLDLSSNSFHGAVPVTKYSFSPLEIIDLSRNYLIGGIPVEICFIVTLTTLDLSNNSIGGQIPYCLDNLIKLTSLNLAYNNLNGQIPLSLVSLLEMNLLNNSLVAQVPDKYRYCFPAKAFVGNKKLCGNIKGLRHCDLPFFSIIMLLVPMSICIGASLFLVISYIFSLVWILIQWPGVKKVNPVNIETKNEDAFSIWNYDGQIAYEDIIKATQDFDIRCCIGSGGYGSVYRAQLPNGKIVALKKLHESEAEEPALRKSFTNEVKTLTEIRHRNIVRLNGFCLHKRSMFLIYEYMERGSLFCVLSNDAEAMELDWSKRVNVIKGIAHALSYMHHDCSSPIVHRDVTSTNILLNSKLEAFVSDFGTAKLIDPDSSNQTMMAGTYGYIAP